MGIWRSIVLLMSVVTITSIVLAACGDEDDGGGNGAGEAPVATATAEPESGSSSSEGSTQGDAEAGRAVWEAQCMACHTIDGGDGLGPTWEGLWMHDVTLSDGTIVTADAAYITESIREPGAKIVQGFQPVMPEFDLDSNAIANIIAFIQTLE